jgi:tRNA threonylcarbamoyladenosine biosynthesis protein TsaB
MKKILLHIDTSRTDKVIVALYENGKRIEKRTDTSIRKSGVLLALIEQVLRDREYSMDDLNEISIFPGPGSFTGLRVGAAVGNMLAALLGIPINGKPLQSPVIPHYQKE